MTSKFPAKWITQTMRGAPQIVAQPGAVILAIDALLLSGWGATTAVSITVQGGVATAVMNEGIYFEEFSVVLIAGVTSPAQLNGEAFVFSRTNKSISFITDAPDGVAAGNFTIKYAPVGGWEKTYSDTNKAVYRSLDPKSPGHFLRVDDTDPQSVRVRAFETMTDIDTGTGPYPTDAQCAGGGYWYKNYLATANNTVIPYVLAGDNLMMLVAISGGITSSAGRTGTIARGFGLPISLAPAGDPWSCLLSYHGNNPNTGSGSGALCGGSVSGPNGATAMARTFSGTGGSVYASQRPSTGAANAVSGNDATLGKAPSSIDGQLKLSNVFLFEASSDGTPRSVVPGIRYMPQSSVMSVIRQGSVFRTVDGKSFVALDYSQDLSSNVTGVYLFEISGSWRDQEA